MLDKTVLVHLSLSGPYAVWIYFQIGILAVIQMAEIQQGLLNTAHTVSSEIIPG